MADSAKRGSITGPIVYAKDLYASDRHGIYYCTTNGCRARMYAYAPESNRARFNSYDITQHISTSCIMRELEYNPHKNREDLFDLDDFINNNCAPPVRNEHGTHTGNAGHMRIENREETPINTIYELYTQCLVTGLNNTYNGYSINDILACRDNFSFKSTGFENFHLVETTYYRYEAHSIHMYFNYPTFIPGKSQPPHVRVNFSDSDKAYRFYLRHFAGRKGSYKRLIIIGGVWRKSDNPNYICECNIYKQSQIKFIG